MIARITAYFLSIAAVLTLIWVQVDMSRRVEDFSERKEIRAYETGMSSRDFVPFSKFDPRSKTAQQIQRSGNDGYDFVLAPVQGSSVFSAFKYESIGLYPLNQSEKNSGKEKIYLLIQTFRI